jgi:hypothetical protein
VSDQPQTVSHDYGRFQGSVIVNIDYDLRIKTSDGHSIYIICPKGVSETTCDCFSMLLSNHIQIGKDESGLAPNERHE